MAIPCAAGEQIELVAGSTTLAGDEIPLGVGQGGDEISMRQAILRMANFNGPGARTPRLKRFTLFHICPSQSSDVLNVSGR